MNEHLGCAFFSRYWFPILLVVALLGGCSRQGAPAKGDANNPTNGDTSADANGDTSGSGSNVSSDPRIAPPIRGAAPLIQGAADPQTETARAAAAPGLQLPPGESPLELKTFLALADREIEELGSGRSGIEGRSAVVAELRRVAELKQQAAERLLDNPAVGPEDRTVGTRARMQALSHKAALGDLSAAETLEQFAIELLNHPVDDIARDSRAVLIGFALERLQGGITEQPEEVLRFVAELASRPELLDASSLMAMQRAMSVLGQYGYLEAAETVRHQIASAFGGLDDPQLTQLAMDVLASARFEELERMRQSVSAANAEGADAEEVARWGAEAAEVAAQNPDMMTLRYLVSLALQMESTARVDEAAAVYAAIEKHLLDQGDPEVTAAAGEAIRAHDARRTVVGQPLEIAATTDLAGEPFELKDFRGSVVLMPFWAVEDAGSTDALPGIEQLAADYGPPVKIVGVNMDVSPAGQNRASGLARNSMPWPSIAAADDGGTAYASQLARRLGVNSLPTVVVLNQAGEVAAVALSQVAVENAVEELLAR